MNSPPIKMDWQERVIEIERYHKSRLREDIKQTIETTAKELNRSTSRTSEDLMIASWIKTYPKILKFTTIQEALDFIRDKKREQKLA
jgi:hypothetical protein